MRRTAIALLVGLMPLWAACGGGDDGGGGSTQTEDPPTDGGTPPDDGGGGGGGDDGPTTPDWLQFDGAWVTSWTADEVQRMERGPDNTLPIIVRPDTPLSPEYYIWDWWPLRTRDGAVATVGGWTVLIALTASRADYVPGERHGVAAWRYWYTQGDSWTPGGLVFPEGTAIGGRQWAGCASYDADSGRATFYYTALGDLPPDEGAIDGATDGYDDAKNAGSTILRQEIVEVSADVVADADGVRFENFSGHDVILTADGDLYATAEQSAAGGLGPYVFRDPWFFVDPADGREYLLFTAAAAFNPSPHAGVAGLATRDSPEGDWYLLPPVLGAFEVNSQIERPHMLVQDGRYYLFFTSHSFTFAEGLEGPEGLFGFVSDEAFRGRYVPLNDSGLVFANPQYEPYETYSYLVLPGGWVTGYINYFDLGDVTLAGIIEQSPEWQRDHFGGTPTPLIRIGIDGAETAIVDTLTARGLGRPVDTGTQNLAATLGEIYPYPE